MKKRLDFWALLLACLFLVFTILPAPVTSALPEALLPAGSATSWESSPDGSVVLYRTNSNELRVVRVSNHADELITASANLLIRSVLSPNGAYVAYFMNLGASYELWLAATDGTTSRLVLSASADQFGGIQLAKFTPDGSYFLYTTTPTNASKALFSVATAGSAAPVQLNPPPIMTFEIHSYIVSPDSSHVVFTQIITNSNYNLVNVYSAPVAGPGSASVKLNQNGSSTVYYGDPVISPDSQRVIIPDSGFYSMDLNGGNRAQLSQAGATSALAVSADSTRVVYGWENGGTMNGEYYVVPIGGPMAAAVQVISVPRIEMLGVTFSADGSRVVAFARPSGGSFTLYSGQSQGPSSAAVELAVGYPVSFSTPTQFVYWPTTHVAYTIIGSTQVWSVPVGGPASATQPITPGQASASVTHDGQKLVYLAGRQVYSVQLAGSLSGTRNESLLPDSGGPVSSFMVTADSQRLFFGADGAVYVTTLGTGLPVAWLQPECQSIAPTAGPTPTPDPTLLPRLYLPAMQRCNGVQ